MGELPDPGLPRSWLDLVLRTDGHRVDHRAEDRKESGHAGRERGMRIQISTLMIYQLIGGGLYFRSHGERRFKVLVN